MDDVTGRNLGYFNLGLLNFKAGARSASEAAGDSWYLITQGLLFAEEIAISIGA